MPAAPIVAARERDAVVCLATEAMATRFELLLPGEDTRRLRAAGEEALEEIRRLARQLSFYDAASDIAWINAHAADGPVRVEPRLLALLGRCRELSIATDGAFDITAAPLVQVWRRAARRGLRPDAGTVSAARARVGCDRLELDAAASTVRFAASGMALDLGAAGKGFAIDAAMAMLRVHGVSSAFLHGGTSSASAIGCQPSGEPWQVAWAPANGVRRTFVLRDRGLSVSGGLGSQNGNGDRYAHVVDPRTGEASPVTAAAAILGPAALECDALSTALLIHGRAWLPIMRERFPDYEGVSAGPV